MSTLARDALKTRAQRVGEVYSIVHLKAGQANSQIVSFGGDLTVHTTNTQFALSDTEYVLGQKILNKAAQTAIVVAAGSDLLAGQFRKILVQMDAAGTITQKVGALVATQQSDAIKPVVDSDKIEVGWLEVGSGGAVFTPGTTVLTTAMLKKAAYWTWADVLTANNGK